MVKKVEARASKATHNAPPPGLKEMQEVSLKRLAALRQKIASGKAGIDHDALSQQIAETKAGATPGRPREIASCGHLKYPGVCADCKEVRNTEDKSLN